MYNWPGLFAGLLNQLSNKCLKKVFICWRHVKGYIVIRFTRCPSTWVIWTKGLVLSLLMTEIIPVDNSKRYSWCASWLLCHYFFLSLQHCWGLSQLMCFLYKTLSSLNKNDKKTYIAFKGSKVQFPDTEVLKLSSYFRLIEGEVWFIA